MAGSRRLLELAFAIGGKLDPTFIRATGDAGKQIDQLSKKSAEAAKAAKLQREQARQMQALSKLASDTGAAWGRVGASIIGPIKTIGMVGAAVGGAVYALGAKTANVANEQVKNAKKIGMSTKAYLELSYAAAQSNISQETLSTSMRRLNLNIGAAAKGNKEAQFAFKRLGVSIYDARGKLKSTDQIMMEASRTFAKMPEGIYKADLAMAVFGKSGAELVPLLEQGEEALRKQREEAQRLGLVLSDEAGAKAVVFSDSMTTAQGAMKGLGMAIGEKLWGPLTKLTDAFSDWVVANREWIATNIGEVITRLEELFKQLNPHIVEAKKTASELWEKIDALATRMGGWEPIIKKLIAAWAIWNGLQLANAFAGATIQSIKFAAAIAANPGLILKMMGPTGMLISGIGKLGSAFVACIPAIVKFGVALLANPITWIVLGIVAVVAGLYMLWKHWDKVTAWLSETWDGVTKWFSEAWDTFAEVFSKIGEQISQEWDAVTKWLGEAWDSVVNYFKGIWDNIVGWFTEKFNKVTSAFDDGIIQGIITLLGEFNPAMWLLEALNKMIESIFGINLMEKGKEWLQGFIDGMLNAIRGVGAMMKDALFALLPNAGEIAAKVKSFLPGPIAKMIPSFAEGGWITKPQLVMAGEDGPEVIVPVNRPQRAMELMSQAAGMLPMQPMQQDSQRPAEALSKAISVSNSRTTVGGNTFSFSPTVTVNGAGGNAADIGTAVSDALANVQARFERWASEREYQAARVAMR